MIAGGRLCAVIRSVIQLTWWIICMHDIMAAALTIIIRPIIVVRKTLCVIYHDHIFNRVAVPVAVVVNVSSWLVFSEREAAKIFTYNSLSPKINDQNIWKRMDKKNR